MKPISCHRKYPITTNFLDTMLEHSVVIEDGESKLDAYRRGLKELDQIAAELRRETESMRGEIIQETIRGIAPHDARETRQIPEIQSRDPKQDTVAQLIADIYTCTEFKVLEGYRLLAKTKPEIQAAYDQMKLKLTVL